MTYRKLIKTLTDLLQSHAQLKTVKNATPTEWLQSPGVVDFPAALFVVNTGSFEIGNERQRTVQMWFMDKSGQENEFEQDVSSDMEQVAGDIVEKLYNDANVWIIDKPISYTFFRDSYEDFISGVQFTFNISTVNQFDGCDMPTL